MLPILLPIATTVGGFSYRVATLSDRTKRVHSAPSGYAPTWKEHVKAIVATTRIDADFSRLMRQQAIHLQRTYFQHISDIPDISFETWDDAGVVDIGESVISASPDIVCVSVGVSYYIAGTPHPDGEGESSFIWSRRLHRLLAQDDIFAVQPDRALRRLAQSRFNNRDNLQDPDAADGIPLGWDHASIGPTGITWSFGPYELGGYLAGGAATVSWSALRPYLRRQLPFVISSIRETPARSGRGSR